MRLPMLLAWQILTGFSDTAAGLILIFAPAVALRLMGVHAPEQALPFLSWMGAFVLAVGIACLYGGTVLRDAHKLETVWLITAVTRGLVALVVSSKILSAELEFGWISVPITDGALAAVQAFGLMKGWLDNAGAE